MPMTPTPDLPTTTSESSPWLTPYECAARAKCGRKLVYYAIRTGKLKAARLGVTGSLRVHVSWLDAWVSASLVVNPDAPGPSVPLPIPFKTKL